MEQAYAVCVEMLLRNIQGHGYGDDELKHYKSSLKAFVKDSVVGDQLLQALREPERSDLPSAEVLRQRWTAVGGAELPSDELWNGVAGAFRRQATKRVILSKELRDIL